MKTTFDKARRVSRSIGRRLRYPRWYLGVALALDDREGYVIAVRVERGYRHMVDGLPTRIDGVKVRVVEATMARPLTRAKRSAAS